MLFLPIFHIQNARCHRFLFNSYSEYLTSEAVHGFEDFKIRGQLIRTVKYADDLVLLAKKETLLQGISDIPTEIEIYYGM